MTLDEYQQSAVSIAIYPNRETLGGLIYCVLKLNGEAGEVAEKVGKIIRDDAGSVSDEKRTALILELGDVLWYVANAAKELGTTLDDVAERNLAKLASRKVRKVLGGSGDFR